MAPVPPEAEDPFPPRPPKNDYYLFYVFGLFLLFLLLILVYRKLVMKALFSDMSDVSPISLIASARAQGRPEADVNEQGSKELLHFQELTRNTGSIIPLFGPLGPRLESNILVPEVNCISFESIFFQIQLALAGPKGRQALKSSMEQCRSYFSKHFVSFLNLGPDDLKNERTLELHLRRFFRPEVDQKEMSRILEIYRIKAAQKISYNPLLLDKIADLNSGGGNENLFLVKEITDGLRELHSPIFSDFVEILVASKIGNRFWAQNKLTELLERDRREYFFEMQASIFKSLGQSAILENRFKMILTGIKKELNDEKSFKLLLTFWLEMFNGPDGKKFRDEFEYAWSPKDLQEGLQSLNDGLALPSLWFPLLGDKRPSAEGREFIKRTLEYKGTHQKLRKQLWILNVFFPNDRQLWEDSIADVMALNGTGSWYDKYILLELLENPLIKKLATLKEGPFKRPIFNLKRAYYRSLLESGKATDLAIYQLIKLGDLEQDFLWWIIL